jgi:catechol 2,3-dioxygenase-like lactoylglutathione lyase family enzyme
MNWKKSGAAIAVSLIFSALSLASAAAPVAQGDVELQVTSRIHFNTNVRDFEAARAFYGALGFETLTGFPDTNTQAMAEAIGVTVPTAYDGSQGGEAGGYFLHGELIGVNGFKGGVIDLIEFTIPRNEASPYPRLNRLGMVSADMYTTDIDADYAYMRDIGVEFLAAPVARADGSRFAVFKDQDGTFYKLVEVPGDKESNGKTFINSLGAITLNVSDLDESIAWYGMFGYEFERSLPETESIDVARALGFEEEIRIKGAVLVNPADDSRFELIQWISHFDDTPPYPIPINHIGIHRMALATTDIEADSAALRAQGVEFVSEITPCCSGPDSSSSIVVFYDPDGILVELAHQPWIAQYLFPIILWFRDLFD